MQVAHHSSNFSKYRYQLLRTFPSSEPLSNEWRTHLIRISRNTFPTQLICIASIIRIKVIIIKSKPKLDLFKHREADAIVTELVACATVDCGGRYDPTAVEVLSVVCLLLLVNASDEECVKVGLGVMEAPGDCVGFVAVLSVIGAKVGAEIPIIEAYCAATLLGRAGKSVSSHNTMSWSCSIFRFDSVVYTSVVDMFGSSKKGIGAVTDEVHKYCESSWEKLLRNMSTQCLGRAGLLLTFRSMHRSILSWLL